MSTARDHVIFTIAPVGPAYLPETQNAASIANLVQRSFEFVVDGEQVEIDEATHTLQNRAIDYVAAISGLRANPDFRRRLEGELILVTSNPDSDPETARDYEGHPLREQCYFYRDTFPFAKNLAFVSTFVWQHLPLIERVASTAAGQRHVQPYLMLCFAMIALNRCLGSPLPHHSETRGCPLDYCEVVADIDRFFVGQHGFCDGCIRLLDDKLHSGVVSAAQLRAVQWLLLKAMGSQFEYDIFMCHASEDKETAARPLYEELSRRGIRVWFDEAALRLGESLSLKIDEGLRISRFGVVILSETFFKKDWPQKELRALLGLQHDARSRILPILHGVGPEVIKRHSPDLHDHLAGLSTAGSMSTLAGKIERALAT
jgi:hypothetical protein